ncbi:hypothetical protein ABZX99_15295 [Streptomyces antibioticus]|uniref:hypothetical protein n=1 Tax=Streptomyces antibioticus TaxID=1890 RepID=UPI0033BDC0FA
MSDEDLRTVTISEFVGASPAGVDDGLRGPSLRARARLRELVLQLRDDLPSITDPHARNLFATTADLLVALDEAFADAQARASGSRTGL